jgi:hypothetical protein
MVMEEADDVCSYLEVEKRKKGEVSLNARALCAARASAHILRRVMVVV